MRYFVPLLDKEGYIISDWRGVPRVIYDEGGKEVWRGEFGPFGEPLYERGVVSNYIPFRLYGMYKDVETGLYYNVRRYYDWRVGRYLQPDPVSDLNLYAYVSNSPHDLVDPIGMFKTVMRPLGLGFIHAGSPHHEKITEDAVSTLGYTYLKWFGPAEDYWKDGPWWYDKAQCRGERMSLAQGANRADCLYEDDSSYHCDNNNFDGCRKVSERLLFPTSTGVVVCGCVDCSGGSQPPSYPPPSGGGPGKGEGGGGGGCSVSIQRLKEKAMPSECYKAGCRDWQCAFRAPENFETLGRYLHPVQDFWSHSNAVFVTICIKVVGWIDKECAEYKVVPYYSGTEIPSPETIEGYNELVFLFSGLYGGSWKYYSWSASDDIICQKAVSAIIGYLPPCDLQVKAVAHCMLNKDDNVGPDRDCFDACDQGDWPGDCGGDDNVQRYAFWDARNLALTSTVHYLFVFCQEAPNLCY
jgi:RHS repeat-associated protein